MISKYTPIQQSPKYADHHQHKSLQPQQQQQSPKQYLFIKKGPHGEEIYRVTHGTRTYYLKKNLTTHALKSYQLAREILIGPNAKYYFARNTVQIEEGVDLIQAINQRMVLRKDLYRQLSILRTNLEKNEIAHCDVKYANCFYFPKVKRALLIDNGDMTPYGQSRPVRTHGENTTLVRPNNVVGVTSKFTDRKGFNSIFEYLKKHTK